MLVAAVAPRLSPFSLARVVENGADLSISFAGVEKVSSSKSESEEVGEEMRNEGSDGPGRCLSVNVDAEIVVVSPNSASPCENVVALCVDREAYRE